MYASRAKRERVLIDGVWYIHAIEDFGKSIGEYYWKESEVSGYISKESTVTLLAGLICKVRYAAKERKEYKYADQLRRRLIALGYEVQDTKEGTLLFPF